MKSGIRTVFPIAMEMFVLFFFASCASFPTSAVQAQDNGYEEQSEKYGQEELAQMLAPIALYPDALLAQVLMASTYPIEIVEADRWARKNPDLKDEDLDNALLEKDWAPSVKAVCHFPGILAIMSERIGETTEIGNAFSAQEEDVMKTVQDLRAKAHAEGHLQTTSNQKVIVQKETIVIEPVNPSVIYVPYYDPYHVYGAWWYPAYPPYYWRPYGSYVSFGVSYWPAYYFSFSFGHWSRIDWHKRYVYIDAHKRPKFVRHDRWKQKSGRWHHSSEPRRGVAYRGKYKHKPDGYGYHRENAKEVRRGFHGSFERGGRDRDNRYGADRERDGMEKQFREKSGAGTVNVGGHGRGLVESDKEDGRSAYERFGKVRWGRPSKAREAEGHQRGTSYGVRNEGVGRTREDAKSVGIVKQQKRGGRDPGRPGSENGFERFDGGRRGGSHGDRGSIGKWNREGGFHDGGDRIRTGTGRGNKEYRGRGDRGGESGGFYRGGGRGFGNR